MSNYSDIMLDIETLGTRPDAVIVSIGYVFFNPHENTVDEQYGQHHVFSVEDMLRRGRSVSDGTINFWMKNGHAWPINDETEYSSLDYVLDHLNRYTFENDIQVWSHRQFDIEVLNNFWYFTMGEKKPLFNFRNLNDSNQLFRANGLDPRIHTTENVHHNALGDAIVQARAVNVIYKLHRDRKRSDG